MLRHLIGAELLLIGCASYFWNPSTGSALLKQKAVGIINIVGVQHLTSFDRRL